MYSGFHSSWIANRGKLLYTPLNCVHMGNLYIASEFDQILKAILKINVKLWNNEVFFS